MYLSDLIFKLRKGKAWRLGNAWIHNFGDKDHKSLKQAILVQHRMFLNGYRRYYGGKALKMMYSRMITARMAAKK